MLCFEIFCLRMSYTAKDHPAMQRYVCGVCIKKTKTLKNMTARVTVQIQKAILPEFGFEDWHWLPTVIREGCYKVTRTSTTSRKKPRYLARLK